jgi:hypothetical protein
MEKRYRNIFLFFVSILLLVTWGFYKSYILYFPNFEGDYYFGGSGLTYIQHIHGALMFIWICFLIIQPLLIKKRLYKIHKTIGIVSYFLVPLLLFSIFMVQETNYYRVLSLSTPKEAIATINGLAYIPAFALFYALAIVNKKNIPKHMRYMIGTSLLFINPALSRALMVFFDMGASGFAVSDYVAMTVAVFLIGYDYYYNKNCKPYSVILVVLLGVHLIWFFRYSDMLQSIGGKFASNFFKTTVVTCDAC